MEQQAHLFKDDTLHGIFLSIQNLQHQKAETKANNSDAPYVITKYNPLFRNLINFLDLIFSFGLKDAKKGYWPYVKKIAHSSVMEMVEKHKYATTEVKKGYIWLFLTFIENSLDGYIRMMVSNMKHLKFFYKNYALLRDTERCEILFNLLIGLETFNFSLNFDDPYLDFGHDPVLRQEKIIIRVQPNALQSKKIDEVQPQSSQQPDVTINPPGVKTADYPDLLEAQQNLLLSKPSAESSPKHRHHAVDIDNIQDLDMDLVGDVSVRPKAAIRNVRSISDGTGKAEVSSINGSLELAEDNYIPEMLGSPEYSLCMSEDEADILAKTEACQLSEARSHASITSDPMIKSFSENDRGYQQFLETYKNEDKVSEEDIEPMGNRCQGESTETVEENENSEVFLTHVVHDNDEYDDINVLEEDLLTPITPVVDKIQKLGLCDAEGYQLTYVSDGEDDDVGITRSDSFDRFCRKDSCESSASTDDGETHLIPELHRSASVLEVTHKTDESRRASASATKVSIERLNATSLFEINEPNMSQIYRSASISKLSADRMNVSRHDMRIGFLLPTLPRRPDLKEAANRTNEIMLDQNQKVLLSVEIFHHPTELPVKMFKVYIGSLVGVHCTMYLLVSTISIYLLDERGTVQGGYVCMSCIDIDCINKVQTGLNFQDVYVSHDDGCFHVSTADEIVTRSILLTIKSVIKTNSGAGIEKEQPMAANTNNELDLIIQDWLICHTRVEDPEILHFVLMQFSVLIPHERKNRVLKSGYASCRHFLVAGVKTSWDKAFFSLRGHMLYKYSSYGNEVKNVYDLSKKCGGCVHSGTDGGRFMFRIIGEDGSTPLVELGVDNENEANEWLMTICQVVADMKNGPVGMHSASSSLVNCGLVITSEKIHFFNQDPKSGRLALEESCAVADITQVCIDNESRTYCTLILDQYVDEDTSSEPSKVTWLLNFQSEYELGKFEQKLYDCWETLYQVPLQFVLLSDVKLKRKIENLFARQDQRSAGMRKNIMELVNC